MATPKSDIPKRRLPRSLSSRFLRTATVTLEQLPSLTETPAAERNTLFVKKVQQCCYVFDFVDSESDLSEKEIKRLALLEVC